MRAYVQFNGRKSIDLGLHILNEVEHASTHHDIDQIEVPGRDGVLLKDNHRLVPVEKSFPCKLSHSANLTTAQAAISDWLNVKGWQDMVLSWDLDYIYKASVIEGFEVKEILRQFGKVKFNFLVHPIKYLKTGRNAISLTKGMVVTNPGNVPAKPVLTLRGSGNGTITINGRVTTLENVQRELVIDMDKHLVYSGNLAAWDKVVRSANGAMPSLDVGRNTITWTGNFTLSMMPNWGVKI